MEERNDSWTTLSGSIEGGDPHWNNIADFFVGIGCVDQRLPVYTESFGFRHLIDVDDENEANVSIKGVSITTDEMAEGIINL